MKPPAPLGGVGPATLSADDVAALMASATLFEDAELSGFAPFSAVWAARTADVVQTLRRVAPGDDVGPISAGAVLLGRPGGSVSPSDPSLAPAAVYALEVRAVRMHSFGAQVASRATPDDSGMDADDRLYYHPHVSLFSSSPTSFPSPDNCFGLFRGGAVVTSGTAGRLAACVLCQKVSPVGDDDDSVVECSFCGACVTNGISMGDLDVDSEGDETSEAPPVVEADAGPGSGSGSFASGAGTGKKGLLTVNPDTLRAPRQREGAPRGRGAGAGRGRGSDAVASQIAASLFRHSEPRTGRGARAGPQGRRGGAAGDAPPGRSPYERFKGPKPMIVLDGPNVAMRHGKGKVFSCAGIQHAIVHYQSRGHTVVVILPESYLDSNRAALLKRAAEKLGQEVPVTKIPDNVQLLTDLLKLDLLITTPSQDYDDSYTIKYAQVHNACILTNDQFRDYVDKHVEADKAAARSWLRSHCISFTFARDELIPNPDFLFPEEAAPSASDAGPSFPMSAGAFDAARQAQAATSAGQTPNLGAPAPAPGLLALPALDVDAGTDWGAVSQEELDALLALALAEPVPPAPTPAPPTARGPPPGLA